MSFTEDERDKGYTDNDLEGETLEGTTSRRARLKSEAFNYQSDSSSEDYHHSKENEDESKSEDDMFAYENKDESQNESNKVIRDDGILTDDEFVREDNGDRKLDNSSLNKESIYGQEEQEDTDKLKQEQIDYYTGIEKYDDILYGNKEAAKVAPQIEKFSMEEDEAEIDEDGNYIPHRNIEENQDEEWMSMKKRDIVKVQKAQNRREEMARKGRETKQLTELAPLTSLLKTLIHLIGEEETPMDALARLLPRKSRGKKNTDKMLDVEERVRRATTMKITDLCESLIENKGIPEAYELSKEQLIKLYKEEAGESFSHSGRKRTYEELEIEELGERKFPEDNSRKWEFKWKGEETIHGTYTDYEMYYWSQNYFEDRVVVRKKGDLEFVPIYVINFQV